MDQVELKTLVEGNNAFAFDLYQTIKKDDDNLFYSPYGISKTLAMVYAGARGETAKEMAESLQFILEDNRLYRAFGSLDQELSRRGTNKGYRNKKGFEFYTVNVLWAQKGYTFFREFFSIINEGYKAELKTTDFAKNPEKSRIAINKWISNQTKNRIKNLIPQGAIDTLARLIMTNAVYFNAAWNAPFEQAATYNDYFYLLDGNPVVVPMMRQTDFFGYADGENYQALDMYYDGSELSMLVLLPREKQFASFQNSLNAELVSSIIKKLEYREVALTIPKFKFGCGFNLNKALTMIGISHAFTRDADFSGVTSGKDIYINNFMHSAFISVDEAGTEAASVSAMMAAAAEPGESVEIIINRPFIFLIRDIATKLILFVGRVINPNTLTAL
jgi:serpin B